MNMVNRMDQETRRRHMTQVILSQQRLLAGLHPHV
jgi:hypothetical protein